MKKNTNKIKLMAIVQAVSIIVAFSTKNAALAAMVNHSNLRHNIREIVTFDSERMEKMVNEAINSKENDDEAFFSQAADALSDTVLVHPRFTEREAGLGRLKSKMDQEEYFEVMRRSASKLVKILKDDNSSPADQATALMALTNWVIEARHLPEEEMKATLEKVASAQIEISDEAREFGREPLERMVSPSEEAQLALAK